MKEFELKQLVGRTAFYCRVKYEVDIFDEANYYVDCGISDKWVDAIRFSSKYFFEKFSMYKKRGFKLKIYEINDMIIDTSDMVVFYTIIKLLSKETGYIIPDLTLNVDGYFLIPK